MQQLGIDIAKEKFDVALVVDPAADTVRFKTKSFSNDLAGFQRLMSWLGTRAAGPVHACMEATGPYWEALAEYLSDKGQRVSVANPGLVKKESESWGMRNKTDEVDARVIALYCLAKRPRQWVAPPAEVRQLRDLTRHLQDLQEQRQAHLNRLDVVTSPTVRASLGELVAFLDERISEIDRRIADHISQHPMLRDKCALVDSITGIGMKTAAVAVAELPDVSNLATAKAAAAYAGLSPKRFTSGKFTGQTKLCKMGNSRLRKALYFPAIVATRFNPVIREFYRRLRKAGKTKMSAIGACMRKLVAIIYGVLKTGTPFRVPA